MRNTHLPAFAGWQISACSLVKMMLSSGTHFFQKTGKNCLIVFFVLFCTAGDLFSQTITWTGATNTDWNTGSNWSGGVVPDAGNIAVIPNTANDPVLSAGIDGYVNGLTVLNGAVLTISNGQGLYVVFNSSQDIGILNQGTVINNGWVEIWGSFGIGLKNEGVFNNLNVNPSNWINFERATIGIWNASGTFDNQGYIRFKQIETKCIYNAATFNNGTNSKIDLSNTAQYVIENFSGTFTNLGQLLIGGGIGNLGAAATHGLVNRSVFNNNAGGLIQIKANIGICILNAAGTFNNAASISMPICGWTNYVGIQNAAIFNNNAGTISLTCCISYGLWNSAGTFTNSGTITSRTVTSNGTQKSVFNQSTFNNSTNGVITLNDGLTGIENEAGTFTNQGSITVGDYASFGTLGITNSANFNNSNTGNITIRRASDSGILNSAGTFTNAGTIATVSAGMTHGINNAAVFNNNGNLDIELCAGSGLLNAAGTFNNAANINIGLYLYSTVLNGIENAAIFNNNTGGVIKIDRSTSYGIWNEAGTFTNAATISIGSTAAVGTRCIYNEATFNNNTGGVINANNSSTYGIEHVAGAFTNAATINIGSTSAVGTYGLRNSATFNNNAGGQINIDRCTSFGLRNNAGAFTNKATLTIGSVAAVGTTGISNAATINNVGGTINIDRVTTRGIINVTGTIANTGILNIGNNAASSMSYGIENDAAFSNSGSGQIEIDRSTSVGLWNSAGTFTNAATINIGSLSAVGTSGLRNVATFNNNAGGQINIDRSTDEGILNDAGTFTNAATINIGNATASAMGDGIQNNAAFNNNGSGQIKIDRSTEIGLRNNGGTFTNGATLTIGSTAAIGDRCIYNNANGTFNNNTGGVISANNASLYAIEHISGMFTNTATINIGSVATAGTYGLRNSSTFNNNTGGVINIDRSTSFGLRNNAGTFTNAATLTIGSLAAVGTTGISNSATISNNAGGTINIDRSTLRGIIAVAGSTFTNAAIINIGALAASSMPYGIDNSATFNNNTGGQIKIDRYTTSGIFASAGAFINQASITIGSLAPVTDLVIANTGTFSNGTGGVLKGTGEIAAANFTNAGGTLSPGYSPGKMTFTAGENFNNNTLSVELNGTGTAGVNFDQVVVMGTATLGGTLAVSVNYMPVIGNQFTILSATAISGTFGAVTGLPANWYVNYTSTAVILTFGAVLPVELVNFTARLVGDAVQLDWRTASERNNEGFYIERMTVEDGQWKKIGFAPGHGTTTETNDYSFLDERPLPGLNYYRLRQVDFDGHSEYSNIVRVELAGKGSPPVLFPNPASTAVYVQISQEFTEGKLAVFDMAGRLVFSQDLEAGSQSVQLRVADLASGTYFCRFELDRTVFLERLQIR